MSRPITLFNMIMFTLIKQKKIILTELKFFVLNRKYDYKTVKGINCNGYKGQPI